MLNSVLVIIVDDHLPGQLSFPQRFFTVKESQQCATVPVTRTYGSNGRVSVTYQVRIFELAIATVHSVQVALSLELIPHVCASPFSTVVDERWGCACREGLHLAERQLGL